jgi:predicted ATPase/class 3 adenylate cyclase
MPRELPTGVVTLLFTDVEGSTKLLREIGDAYAEAVDEHRRVLRSAFAAHHGVEVDTQGDAFFVAFSRASDAVGAVVDAQRGLAGGPIRVRMGLHTGEPRLTEEGYVGLDVHKGARIAAVGHGGQVLLSQATRALVGVEARDLGPHRLKDLSAPERIYQLEIDGLPSEFPPLKTLDAGSTNLPASRTSFVGRADELEAIDRLLEDPGCRLLTLVGPGGVGKTRLALEAAGRRLDRYQHGVHFVPLASVASPDFLAPAMAESLQFPVDSAHSGFAAQDQLLDFLSERSTLLVLDNFEHLVEGSELLSQVIERAPRVEMMATSRERLGVQSEWVFDVEGLRVSGYGGGPAVGDGAIRLFVERARQSDSAFSLNDEERPQAARICRLVYGMPLGIELAAAWVSMLSCAEIADEIERSIGFLSTTARDVPERHRSLRAVFDQSWRLLTDEQRHVFERLSVFRGSFTRDAAAAVAGADLRLLFELSAKSLVRRLDLGRYELHELLRQYAADKLAADAPGSEAALERHARFYVGLLESRRSTLLGPRMAEARDELRSEVDNLRTAVERAAIHWDDDEARAAFDSLNVFLWMHSWFEGAEIFERISGLLDGSTSPKRVSALVYQTALASSLGYEQRSEQVALECLQQVRELDLARELGKCLLTLGIYATHRDVYPEAVAFLEEAEEMTRATGDPIEYPATLSWLGFVRLLMGDLEGAREAFQSGYDAATEDGNPLLRAYLVTKLGLLADAEGEFESAMEFHRRGHDLFTSVGDVGGTGYTLSRSSMSAYCLGDYPKAMRLGRAGFEAFSAVNHRWGVISALCRMGFAAVGLGEFDEARRHLQRALELAQQSQAQSLVLHALSGSGVLLAREGDTTRAAQILLFSLNHPSLPAAYRMAAQPDLDVLEAELPPDDFAAAREAAATADLEEIVEGCSARPRAGKPIERTLEMRSDRPGRQRSWRRREGSHPPWCPRDRR